MEYDYFLKSNDEVTKSEQYQTGGENNKNYKRHINKILVIEPHPDDGVYSAGGTLSKLNKMRCKIFGACLFSNTGDNSNARHMEEQIIYKEYFSSEVFFGELLDAPLRGYIFNDENDTIDFDINTFILVRKKLKNIILDIEPDIVIGPMGIGFHIDHLITRIALLDLWKKNRTFQLQLYEDYPYCNKDKYHYIKAVHDVSQKVMLEPIYYDITHQIDEKVNLHMIYQSQHESTRSVVYKCLKDLAEAVKIEGVYYIC